ncbi:MAG: glycosyltransferase family 9 protein [Verrucomicrobiota bacterium]|nr:glycosyltransferase family 9 protein [Verrucomicrobiota bacterium]
MNEPCSVKRPRILIIRGGAIGDFVLTLPVLSALCERFPKADLEILGYPRIASLALDGGLVKAVHALESPELAMFFSENGILDLEWREFFSGFSIIICYLYDPDKIFEINVKSCGVKQFIPAHYRPDETKMIHASELFLKPLEILTIFNSDPVARLSIESELPLEICLALHPGSGSESKNWPEKDWKELIGYLLHNTSIQLLLIGGEAEGEKLQRLAHGMPVGRLEIMQNIPLNKLAKRLARCCGFVGHDSGVTHIASALGLPVLVLWGPSCEKVWMPLGERVRILNRNNQLSEITLNHVVRELNALQMDLN